MSRWIRASEALYTLKPVTFRYKKAVDPSQALYFGLIAEEVAEVNPALITRDKQGKPQTVRYEAVNAMLLNEFLKEHREFVEQRHEVEKLKATIGRSSGGSETTGNRANPESERTVRGAWADCKSGLEQTLKRFATSTSLMWPGLVDLGHFVLQQRASSSV